MSFRPRSQEKVGKKEIPTLAEQGERRLEKYSVHLRDASNRNIDSGCKQSYSDLSL